jgi:hypothetical protein
MEEEAKPIEELQRIRNVLRLVDRNIRTVRAFIRLRDGRPQIKYKPHYVAILKKHALSRRPVRRSPQGEGGSPQGEGGALGANRALVRCFAKQISGGEPCVHWLL